MKRRTPFTPEFSDVIELKASRSHEWVESSAPVMYQNGAVQFLGTTIGRKKISLLFFAILVVLGIFLIRSASLQIFSGKGFALLALQNKVKTVTISARRGVLYDRYGTLLVQNVPRFVLSVNPAELPRGYEDRKKQFTELERVSGVPAADIEEDIRKRSVADPLILLDEIEYSDALAIIVKTAEMPGVDVVLRDRRNYLFASTQSLSHIIGYMGSISPDEYAAQAEHYLATDSIGKGGIELQYERELRGIDGRKEIEVDALGAARRIVSEEPPQDGRSITLTIDKGLQDAVELSLTTVLEKFKTHKGVAIASDPQTGEILAMVSLPSFDNNIFSKKISPDDYNKLLDNPDRPLYNRAIQGEYPSGSTIKPIVAAAGLQEHIITRDTYFMSSGGIAIGKWFFPDWKAGGHGRTDVIKALAESVNTYFYIVAGGYKSFSGLGHRTLLSYYRLFGIDKKTGIDLPGEHSGFVPSPEWKKEKIGESWYIGDTYHIAIGQGDIFATPLRIHTMTEYFSNSGWAAVPRVFHSYAPSKDTSIPSGQPRYTLKGGIDAEHIRTVREGLRQTVLAGSGRRLSTLPVTAAGKTGTAQWKSTARPHAWFTGWAPFENPQIVVTVLVEEGEEGSRSAIAVADDIFRWYFKNRSTPVDSTPAKGAKASKVDKTQ